jgi:CIC family chloride channel protein
VPSSAARWWRFGSAADLDWWRRLLAPAAGGLIVGLVIYWLIPQRRPLGIADVVEVVALRAGRMPFRDGVVAALVSAMSIGAGASVGREGPAVHLGATLASVVAAALHLTRTLTQTLLGCGVAAAVAASFNAPIAGALFATEVVLGHYALSSFAPVVIASVVATFVSRGWYGPYPALEVMDFPDISL